MDYKKTNFPFLEEDCINEFGDENGKIINALSKTRLSTMLESADYRNNYVIKEHYSRNMFPIISYYLTLQDRGYSKETAYNFVLKEAQKAANIQKRKNKMFSKMPFAYKIFKLFTKEIMKKMYPKEGWETEWILFNNKEIHINFKTCIYVKMTLYYGCPELCTVFCRNDEIIFSAYVPKIYFKRDGTIAEGSVCCDFHFMNGKYLIENKNDV